MLLFPFESCFCDLFLFNARRAESPLFNAQAHPKQQASEKKKKRSFIIGNLTGNTQKEEWFEIQRAANPCAEFANHCEGSL